MDHAATTPLDPHVLEAMMPFLGPPTNASSLHGSGRLARQAIENARTSVANDLGADPAEIIFTSGGTEANNLAILGTSGVSGVLVSPAEHEAVLKPVATLAARGLDVEWLSVARDGGLAPAAYDRIRSVNSGTLVSVAAVNNETGAENDIARIADDIQGCGAFIHSDCVQAPGHLALDMRQTPVDAMTVSAHKINGPVGAGCLFVRSGTPLEALIRGGAQERGRRGGTENVAAVVGFAEALRRASRNRDQRAQHVEKLRDDLRGHLHDALGDAIQFVSPAGSGAPHVLTAVVRPVSGNPIDGEMLLLSLDIEGLEVSSGSACTSGSAKPSHVLLAAGWDESAARSAVRFSLGWSNTHSEVARAAEIFTRCVDRMRRQRSAAIDSAHAG